MALAVEVYRFGGCGAQHLEGPAIDSHITQHALCVRLACAAGRRPLVLEDRFGVLFPQALHFRQSLAVACGGKVFFYFFRQGPGHLRVVQVIRMVHVLLPQALGQGRGQQQQQGCDPKV